MTNDVSHKAVYCQNAVASAPLKELLVLPHLKELSLSPLCHPGTSHLGTCLI